MEERIVHTYAGNLTGIHKCTVCLERVAWIEYETNDHCHEECLERSWKEHPNASKPHFTQYTPKELILGGVDE